LDVDVCCIAMPVRDFAGRCIAAIGVSGPAWRMQAEDLVEKEARLKAAAQELSELLGYREVEGDGRLGKGI
jgi:DNA-binding IclR family transcriptional regulator